MAKSLLEVANIRRVERAKKDDQLGYYTENMRNFIEGPGITSLKNKIK